MVNNEKLNFNNGMLMEKYKIHKTYIALCKYIITKYTWYSDVGVRLLSLYVLDPDIFERRWAAIKIEFEFITAQIFPSRL